MIERRNIEKNIVAIFLLEYRKETTELFTKQSPSCFNFNKKGKLLMDNGDVIVDSYLMRNKHRFQAQQNESKRAIGNEAIYNPNEMPQSCYLYFPLYHLFS